MAPTRPCAHFSPGCALEAADRQVVDSRIEDCRARLMQAGPEQASKPSAELNSLLRLYESRSASGHGSPQSDMHYLLHTDTHQGRRTAEIVLEWLEAHGYRVQLASIPGLNTSGLASFREAMSDVIKWCAEMVTGYKGWHVVFNLTGG